MSVTEKPLPPIKPYDPEEQARQLPHRTKALEDAGFKHTITASLDEIWNTRLTVEAGKAAGFVEGVRPTIAELFNGKHGLTGTNWGTVPTGNTMPIPGHPDEDESVTAFKNQELMVFVREVPQQTNDHTVVILKRPEEDTFNGILDKLAAQDQAIGAISLKGQVAPQPQTGV